MNILLGGVRGTGPVAGREFTRYGGDTTSVRVRGRDGETIVIDGGTGLRRIADDLRRRGEGRRSVLLLLTHYHLDHLMGLPNCPWLYAADWRVTFAAPVREGILVRDAVERLFAKPFWPVQSDALVARLAFKNLRGGTSTRPFEYGGLALRWCPVHHSEGCTAFRIDEAAGGGSFVFATDIEWGRSSRAERERFLRLCRDPKPADVLFFDGQFTAEEYARHAGWGHSTWEEAVEVAVAAGVGRLEIIHHAPARTDRRLAAQGGRLRRLMARAEFARAGSVYEL